MWVTDFHGFSWRDAADPRTTLLTAHLLAHYPERLGLVVLLGAPALFDYTWRLVRRALDEGSVAGHVVHHARPVKARFLGAKRGGPLGLLLPPPPPPPPARSPRPRGPPGATLLKSC